MTRVSRASRKLAVWLAALPSLMPAAATGFLVTICVVYHSAAAFAEEPIHFINVHGHYVPLGPEFPPKSKMAVKFGFGGMPVSEFFASMDRWGVDIFINELSPSSIWKGGTHDDYGIPKLSELYPRRVVSLFGGKALRLLYRAVEKGRDSARHERKFVRLIERAMQSGKYKGFGEIGLHHMETVKRKGPIIPADHPWMLKLADIAAKYDVPIDIHMEATDDNLSALERLLAHNRKAKIIWAHAGWSELGQATADVWDRLMARHSNLYGSIKHRTPTRRAPSPLVNVRDRSGRIEADWLRLFEKFPDRFMIGSDIGPGVFVKHGNDFRHLKHMQAFLRRLPPHLLGPIARDNAIRVFSLPAGGNPRREKGTAPAADPIDLKYSRAELEVKWEARIRSFLAKGVIPLIDLQSSLKRKDGERYLEDALPAMDEAGVALIAFDGFQAKKKNKEQKGYRWGYYIHEAVNAHPDRFILATNGNHNNNSWLKGKGGFIGQIEDHVRSGDYPIMGEFDFRHYMSASQCKKGRTDGDLDIPLDGDNGERVFRLSAETGVPFVIHNEPEDHALDALEKMLKAYPKANVINAHFGQIRHPERETRFTPDLVRRLLATYPNLYYDISTGGPGRRYKCGGDRVLDTVIWDEDRRGRQTDTLKPAYREILTKFSTRFVSGLDYGGARRPAALSEFITIRANNVRLILRDLPDAAKHDIGYRTGWKLLTGKDWR